MCQTIRCESALLPLKSPVGTLRGLLVMLLVCVATARQAHGQLPNIFVADDPSGSVNSGGANIAYLQNTTHNDVTLTLDGFTINTKANRLNVFDRSSGVWVAKAVLDQQSQPISAPAPTVTPTATPTPTPISSNNFLTGLYSYYKLDESGGGGMVAGGAIDARSNRNLWLQGNVGSAPGVINTSRSFDGKSGYLYRNSYSDFGPGANHFFTTFWFKANTLSQINDASFVGVYSTPSNREWLVWWNRATHAIQISVSLDGATATTLNSTMTINDTTSWHFLAAGWDGTNIKISVDGAPYATAAFPGPVYHGSAAFILGAEDTADIWNGTIDEVAVWIGRNDLTISDVQQLYNNGAGLPYSSFQ